MHLEINFLKYSIYMHFKHINGKQREKEKEREQVKIQLGIICLSKNSQNDRAFI